MQFCFLRFLIVWQGQISLGRVVTVNTRDWCVRCLMVVEPWRTHISQHNIRKNPWQEFNNWTSGRSTVHAQSIRSELSRLASCVGVLARSRPIAVVVKETATRRQQRWFDVRFWLWSRETDLSHSLNRDHSEAGFTLQVSMPNSSFFVCLHLLFTVSHIWSLHLRLLCKRCLHLR